MLEFAKAEIRYSPNGVIMPTYPELEEEAYRLANYIANRLFIQTASDAIDPSHVLAGSPEISPETTQEEADLKARKRSVESTLKILWTVQGLFEPSAYGQGFKHWEAYGYYADALRTASDFQKFELLYKVVEHFFPEDGEDLDASVSAHMLPHDSTFTRPVMKQLRCLRNRCIHPRAKQGHLNPQNLANVREVHEKFPQMQKLANLLLAHPTF